MTSENAKVRTEWGGANTTALAVELETSAPAFLGRQAGVATKGRKPWQQGKQAANCKGKGCETGQSVLHLYFCEVAWGEKTREM